jgi:hypothetical protein
MMELRAFVLALVDRIEAAGEKGDKQECIRLLRLLRDTAEEQARKLEE